MVTIESTEMKAIVVPLAAALALAAVPSSSAFTTPGLAKVRPSPLPSSAAAAASATRRQMSSWDGFGVDDDDDLIDLGVDSDFVAADENDDPSVKAAAGMALEAPEVDWDGPVIDVPQGECACAPRPLALGVVKACVTHLLSTPAPIRIAIAIR